MLMSLGAGVTSGCRNSEMPAQDIAVARARIRASAERERVEKALSEPRPATMPQRPQPPAGPRTVTKEVEVRSFASQVYLDPNYMIAHRKSCDQWNRRLLRTPLAAARMQGYVLHPACLHLTDPPEYRKQVEITPEWLEYEKQLTAYETALGTQKLAEIAAKSASITSLTSYSSPAQAYSPTGSSKAASSSSSGVVHVKGHYRKDGTYVRPHTRSKPRN
jgi:hypothetical protein